MRNSLFVIFVVVIATTARRIEKRQSLVSRFTSNPFFLSHFGYNNNDDDYEIYPGIYHFSSDADEESDNGYFIRNSSTEESEEDPPTHNFVNPGDENTHPNRIFIIPIREEELKQAEETQEESEVVESGRPNRVIPIRGEEEDEEEEAEDESVGLIFKSLPLFDKTDIFRSNETTPNKSKETDEESDKIVVFLFKSLPHFDRLTEFKQPLKMEVKNKIALAYFFKSLPHFERSQEFLRISEKPGLFVSRINTDGHNEDSNEEFEVSFKSLPHYEVGKFKEETKPKRRRVLKLIRRKKVSPRSEETDFGRRLIGRRIESIADIPLENSKAASGNVLNSYGGLLSPLS